MASTIVTASSSGALNTPKTPTPNTRISTETPSPGNWKHPRMAEIIRRQKASTFDNSNVLRIACNIAAILGSFVIGPLSRAYFPVLLSSLARLTSILGYYQSFPLQLLRLVFVFNIYQALQPAWKEPDMLSDIPLTPSQRRLLGLEPGSGHPKTPQTQYVTPPKYKRATPRSQSPAWNQTQLGSGSDARRAQSGAQDGFSPSGSPLWSQTARRDLPRDLKADRPLGTEIRRRSGFGLDSIGSTGVNSSRDSLRESSGTWIPSTPSPTSRGAGAGVGLNSKWLYERGRSSSGSRRSFGGL